MSPSSDPLMLDVQRFSFGKTLYRDRDSNDRLSLDSENPPSSDLNANGVTNSDRIELPTNCRHELGRVHESLDRYKLGPEALGGLVCEDPWHAHPDWTIRDLELLTPEGRKRRNEIDGRAYSDRTGAIEREETPADRRAPDRVDSDRAFRMNDWSQPREAGEQLMMMMDRDAARRPHGPVKIDRRVHRKTPSVGRRRSIAFLAQLQTVWGETRYREATSRQDSSLTLAQAATASRSR
jgi:hypothetical protein